MIDRFTYASSPSHIVFGRGAIAKVSEAVNTLGCHRALILSTPHQVTEARAISTSLGDLSAGVFAEATMHTPVDVTERAIAFFNKSGADCVLAYGGGSTIGLGKAIAWRNDAPQIVVATTYAGSEVTPILGQTEDGVKTTVRDAKILPEMVVYDPELTVSLPVAMSMTSGLNAMAHALEGLYARDRNPISTMMAIEGIVALKTALPVIKQTPSDIGARSQALYGSWLCGTVLGAVGMSLHHKLCHTLGGAFNLPHAETHALILPYSIAYNEIAAADELRPATELFGNPLSNSLLAFSKLLGAPSSLKDLGVREQDLDLAARQAVENPYWSPRPIDYVGILRLLQDAWHGQGPRSSNL